MLCWDFLGKSVLETVIHYNEAVLEEIKRMSGETIICEMVACYGMAVGKEVFQTVLWVGRFMEAATERDCQFHLVYRQDIKLHHCKSTKAKDSNVSQSLRDQYGQVGTKKSPGPLYGVKSHLWSALAIATYWSDTQIKAA